MFRISVDPGGISTKGGTGIAIWENNSLLKTETLIVKKTHRVKSAQDKFEELCLKFDSLLQVYVPKLVVIESTQFYANSSTSVICASTGDLLNLTGLLYGYYALCLKRHISVELYKPREWKGNMSKEACEKRIKRIIPDLTDCSEHAKDAVGLGLAKIVKNKLFKG